MLISVLSELQQVTPQVGDRATAMMDRRAEPGNHHLTQTR
jgi:hypothetical protein